MSKMDELEELKKKKLEELKKRYMDGGQKMEESFPDEPLKVTDADFDQNIKKNILVLPLIFFKIKSYECCEDEIDIIHELQTMKIEDAYFSKHIKTMKPQKKREKIKKLTEAIQWNSKT